MNITRILTSSAVAALLAISMNPAAHANLVVNGSFEDSSFGAPGGYTLGLVGSAVPGWLIHSGDGTYPWGLTNGAFGSFTPYGDQFFVLGRYDTVPVEIRQITQDEPIQLLMVFMFFRIV